MGETRTITLDDSYEALEAAGIRVWAGRSGERRAYDPSRSGAYAVLEDGYRCGDVCYCEPRYVGRVSGSYASEIRAVLDGLRS